MRIAPTFFRSQPGRRFAAEPQRATALMLGFDVPDAHHAPPWSCRAARAHRRRRRLRKDVVISRAGGYRFVEDRELRSGGGGHPNVHRAAPRIRRCRSCACRPSEYAAVAADLRRVDGAEQEEIRIPTRRPARGGG